MSNEKNISTIANEIQTSSHNEDSKAYRSLHDARLHVLQTKLLIVRLRSESPDPTDSKYDRVLADVKGLFNSLGALATAQSTSALSPAGGSL